MPKAGNHTGERVEPAKRKRVVGLLAQGKSANQIAKECHISRHTVAAITEADAIPIAQRKQELLSQAARIAGMAADQVEAQISTAPLNQAGVIFGIMADKVIGLSNDPQRIDLQVTHTHTGTQSLFERLDALAKSINARTVPVPRVEEAPALTPSREAQEQVYQLVEHTADQSLASGAVCE